MADIGIGGSLLFEGGAVFFGGGAVHFALIFSFFNPNSPVLAKFSDILLFAL